MLDHRFIGVHGDYGSHLDSKVQENYENGKLGSMLLA